MALKGNLDTFYLSSIFQLLSGDKKTGVLTVTDGSKTVKVYFKKGTIVYAAGTQKEVRLGYLLRTKGIISAEELQNALTLAKQRGERLGKILVEKGYISLETLKRFIHQQVREVLYDLFLWKSGDFEYVDQAIELQEEFLTELNHMEIILEGTRRVDEWAILRKHIPHPQVVFRISHNVEQGKDSINLNANEWRLLSLVDGKRTVQQIITDSGLEEYSAYRILNSLLSSGLIERVQREAAAAQEETGALIRQFHEVIQAMRKLLRQSAGARASAILREALERGVGPEQQWLRQYSFERDADDNARVLLEAAGKNGVGKDGIVVAFNSLVLAVLHQAKAHLQRPEFENYLRGITAMFPQWQEQCGSDEAKNLAVCTVGQTLKQFEQEAASNDAQKEKGGLLGLFRRK